MCYCNVSCMLCNVIIFSLCFSVKIRYSALLRVCSIQWTYLSDLQKLQHDEGLHLGTERTARHIQYYQQKMKVALATQLFSSSVAKLLRTLLEIGHPQFQDSLPTILFLEVATVLYSDLINNFYLYGFILPVKPNIFYFLAL